MAGSTATLAAPRAGRLPWCTSYRQTGRLGRIAVEKAGITTEGDLKRASDQELLSLVVAGREARRGEAWELAARAWRHLAARHHDRVRGLVVAFRFPGNPNVRITPDEYDDAAQECFIRAVKMLGNFRGVSLGEFRGALRTCVTNTCMDYCRRRLTRERAIAGSMDEPSPGIENDALGRFDAAMAAIAQRKQDQELASQDDLGALETAISRMDNERMREVLRRKMSGYSSAEIANELGLAATNVDQLCSRGVRKLRTVMSDD